MYQSRCLNSLPCVDRWDKERHPMIVDNGNILKLLFALWRERTKVNTYTDDYLLSFTFSSWHKMNCSRLQLSWKIFYHLLLSIFYCESNGIYSIRHSNLNNILLMCINLFQLIRNVTNVSNISNFSLYLNFI